MADPNRQFSFDLQLPDSPRVSDKSSELYRELVVVYKTLNILGQNIQDILTKLNIAGIPGF